MKPQLCSPLGRILVLIFGLFASAASPFRADAATCTTSDLASGSAAFVAHSTGTTTSGSVFLVNVSATPNTIQCSISVGKDPTNLAVSPDASLLFVENDADGTVTVVNLTDGTINTTITLTGAPMTANLAVSPDNSKVYVVTLPSPLPATPPVASLYVISLPSLGVSAAIPVTAPATPTPPVSAPGLGVAFSPDATLAFIATEGLTYIVTTASNAVSATSIPANARTAAVQPSGSFAYDVDVAANPTTVAQFAVSASPPAPVIQTPSPQCTGANATAITPDSSLVYYTCPGTNFVQSITAATNTCPGTGCTTILLGPASTGPQGLAVTPDGTSVYVANSDGSISVVSVSGNAVAATISGTAPLRGIGFRLPIVAFISPAPPATTENVPVNATFPFSAGAKFTKNPATVSWSVTCAAGGAACGSIDPVTGIYTAPATPPSPPTVTVTATSNSTEFLFNPRFSSASVTVTVTAPAIIVSVVPASSTVGIDLTDTITATAQNDTSGQGVTGWAVNGTLGGDANVGMIVATDATHATYTAPSVLPPAPSMVSVSATSVADSTQTSTTTLTITSNVTVTVAAPPPPILVSNQYTFTATVTNDAGLKGTTWPVTCPDVTPCGSVGASGTPSGNGTSYTVTVTYTAPSIILATPSHATISATSVADPTKSGSSTVLITSNVTVTVTAPTPPVLINNQYTFTATVTNDAGLKGVTWTVTCPDVTPCGSVGASGTPSGNGTSYTVTVTYTAPSIILATASHATISATSVADPTKSNSSTVLITSNVAVSVMIVPSTTFLPAPASTNNPPTVAVGFSVCLMATITGDINNLGVRNWSPTAGTISTAASPACNGVVPPAGSFTATYTAPAAVPSPATVNVTASAVADPSKTSAPIMLNVVSDQMVYDPANPTGQLNVPAAPATSGFIVIDLQGPPNIPVSAFSCTDLDKLNGKATCTFALNPTPNLITCPATQCTSVTLTLSVVRASAALVGPGSFPPLNAGRYSLGAFLLLLLPFAVSGFAFFRRPQFSARRIKLAFALAMLLCLTLGWASACNQFVIPSTPPPPVSPTGAGTSGNLRSEERRV